MGDLKAREMPGHGAVLQRHDLVETPALISDWAPMMLRVRPPQLMITIGLGDGTKSLKR